MFLKCWFYIIYTHYNFLIVWSLWCRSLNSNRFIGQIPPSFGNLLNVHWLDLADNQLSGSIPVSSGSVPGLDMLVNTKHLYAWDDLLISLHYYLLHIMFLIRSLLYLQSLWKESTVWWNSLSTFQLKSVSDSFVSTIDLMIYFKHIKYFLK